MKVLFDQNIPRTLRKFTPTHLTRTTDEMGWGRLENGELLEVAQETGFHLFVTADKNLRYQQNLSSRQISIIELTVNDWNIIKLSTEIYVAAVEAAQPGGYQTVEYQLPPKRLKPTVP